METREILKEEGIRFSFGLIATALGVFIALSVNNCNENNKEYKQYENMLTAIQCEAFFNSTILTRFKTFSINDSIDIKNEFSSDLAEEFLKSEAFLSRIDEHDIIQLSAYISNLKSANSLRLRDQKYKEEKRYLDKSYADELKMFKEEFEIILKNCEASIFIIIELNTRFKPKK